MCVITDCDISFNITTHNIVVKSAFAIQYSLAFMPLLTCNFHASICQRLAACHVALAQLVTGASFVTCASDFRKKLSDVSLALYRLALILSAQLLTYWPNWYNL